MTRCLVWFVPCDRRSACTYAYVDIGLSTGESRVTRLSLSIYVYSCRSFHRCTHAHISEIFEAIAWERSQYEKAFFMDRADWTLEIQFCTSVSQFRKTLRDVLCVLRTRDKQLEVNTQWIDTKLVILCRNYYYNHNVKYF